MAKNLTPEQFEQACKNAIVAVEKNVSKILINTASIAGSDLQFRIFNQGQTTAGNTMRYRSAPYKRKRVKAGRQIVWKDLEFTGDLRYSINILNTAQREVSYGFNNSETAKIAGYQEEARQVGEKIFELNNKEILKAERQFGLDIMELFTGALENYPNMPNFGGVETNAPARKAKPRKSAPKSATKKATAKAKSKNKKRKK